MKELTQMFQQTVAQRKINMPKNLGKTEENLLLSSLALELDDMLLKLRRSDKLVCTEVDLLSQVKNKPLERTYLAPINEEKLKKIITQLPLQNLLRDEYIVYMIENGNNSIFSLIREYNEYVAKRNQEQESGEQLEIADIDDKLAYYIRRIGAMVYHLHTHLSMINIMLRNSSTVVNT
ncbi:MAG: hypothetical protein WA919_25060 [Coleofasciculaceae cyanobacterium]